MINNKARQIIILTVILWKTMIFIKWSPFVFNRRKAKFFFKVFKGIFQHHRMSKCGNFAEYYLYLSDEGKLVARCFNVFEISLLCSHQGCNNFIKIEVIFRNISAIKFNCFLFWYILKCNLFLWWQSWIFSILIQSSVSHDHLKHFILLSMLKTVVLLYIFVEIVIIFFQDSSMNRMFKRTAKSIHYKW